MPFLRSMGYGGMLIPLVSTVVSITLLPVVLSTLGPRLDWPHMRTDDKASRAWTRWAEAVSRRRWAAAGAGLATILALAGAALGLQLGTSDASTIAKSGSAKTGLEALERAGIGEGALAPHEIVVEGATPPAKVVAALRDVDGIHGAVAPEEWRRGGTAVVDAIPVADSGSDAGGDTLTAVRDAAHAAGADVRVGGGPAANADFIDAIYGSFPLILLLIGVTTFILLARAFRSLLLPLKAIVLNVLSVAAAWGLVVLEVAVRLRLGGDLGHRGDRRDPVVDASDHLRSCSGCRWTTRSSSSPACARSTSAPGPRAPRWCRGWAGPVASSRAPR